MEAHDVTGLVKRLALKINAEVCAIAPQLQPDVQAFVRFKVRDFEYTEGGVSRHSAESQLVQKPSWLRASESLLGRIQRTQEFSAAKGAVEKLFGTEKAYLVDRFAARLIADLLSEKSDGSDTDKYVGLLVMELEGRPLLYRTYVELEGIAILAQPVSFSVGDTEVELRAVTPADLERDQPA